MIILNNIMYFPSVHATCDAGLEFSQIGVF